MQHFSKVFERRRKTSCRPSIGEDLGSNPTVNKWCASNLVFLCFPPLHFLLLVLFPSSYSLSLLPFSSDSCVRVFIHPIQEESIQKTIWSIPVMCNSITNTPLPKGRRPPDEKETVSLSGLRHPLSHCFRHLLDPGSSYVHRALTI